MKNHFVFYWFVLIGLLLSIDTSVAANDDDSSKEPSSFNSYQAYINVPSNQKLFQKEVKSGQIERERSAYLNSCNDDKKGIPGFCACFGKKLKAVSDGEWYFNQMYVRELAKKGIYAQAKGNTQLANEIAQKMLNTTLFGKAEKACREGLQQ